MFPVPHILICFDPPIDSMVSPPGSIMCLTQLLCMGLYHTVPSSLMLAGRPAVVGGAAVLGN